MIIIEAKFINQNMQLLIHISLLYFKYPMCDYIHDNQLKSNMKVNANGIIFHSINVNYFI